MLCLSDNAAQSDRSYLRMLTEFRVDAIVYVPSSPEGARGFVGTAKRIPIVELLRHTELGAFDAIVSDDREGSSALTEHLIGIGHRRIAMVAGPEILLDNALSHCRLSRGDAARRTGRARRARRVHARTSATRRRAQLLALQPAPSAIVVGGSPQTVGVLRALKDADVAVPGDVSLTAFEDPEWYAAQNPPLTCYALPLREMALVAAELVTRRLIEPLGAERSPTVDRFGGRLVVRGSTAPPAGSRDL